MYTEEQRRLAWYELKSSRYCVELSIISACLDGLWKRFGTGAQGSMALRSQRFRPHFVPDHTASQQDGHNANIQRKIEGSSS